MNFYIILLLSVIIIIYLLLIKMIMSNNKLKMREKVNSIFFLTVFPYVGIFYYYIKTQKN
ncbi:hypothetical protein C8P70_1523 [Myroides indicus]|uniref:Uncharacterized protein n=1 Tax=Myroides indicus TaxID=1323422 RepID=A0A4R7ELE5_9FLAO|nr:hypothetical protein C8P70_1523 [Myroides indicus]